MSAIEEVEMSEDRVRDAAYQAYVLLRVGFAAAPILFGLDKFFNWTVHWPDYLAAWINSIAPGSAQDFMYFVGVVEIVAGLAVAVAPTIGGPLVAAWLVGIVVNLLTKNPPEYYDIALRDFGLLLGALTLTRLAWAFRGVPVRAAWRNRHASSERDFVAA
ncbi:MAG TPA: DoxX family protein [Gaiellaceae bacterium]|nr:DoxX family protein [Gaiellaceae bacterium]